ncbi:hypothetical protein QUB27_29895, partial [Microcoleus sp. AT8-B6]
MPNQDRGILGNASFECRRSRRNLYPWWKIPLEWRNGDILVISSLTTNFKGGTSPRIYPWNQSKIENRKSSSPRIYPW